MKDLKPLGNNIQMSIPHENRFGGAAKGVGSGAETGVKTEGQP